jgi:hypothetical protein|tara:strand:+ start:321 stop:797 length:477 start_codon:yes stop_codon:yes gene_type:complete
MKLILENWRNYLEEGWKDVAKKQAAEAGEDISPGIVTIGDLRKVWDKKRTGELTSQVARAIPGLDAVLAVKDTASLLKKLYGAGDDFETQSSLDALNVDDKMSAIVDDKVEMAFLRDLIKQFKGASDDQRLDDFKSTELLQQFLAKKFDSRTITKANK